jgi:hypothetical protein
MLVSDQCVAFAAAIAARSPPLSLDVDVKVIQAPLSIFCMENH